MPKLFSDLAFQIDDKTPSEIAAQILSASMAARVAPVEMVDHKNLYSQIALAADAISKKLYEKSEVGEV